MSQIISVSRRTDIPAFYGDWFMRRIRDGFAGVVNPFGGRRYRVSLRPDDVTCLVFWSKDFTPFLDHLETLERLGYRCYFNYTVTGLPAVFESHVDKAAALKTLKDLSRRTSPRHINWRFDPIILSSVSDGDFTRQAFQRYAAELEGLVERCLFSFVTKYGKVQRNFQRLGQSHGVTISDCPREYEIDLAHELAAIAARHGITLYSCCGDDLLGDQIQRAHCIDGALIGDLFFPDGFDCQAKPTRPGCGCSQSIDIGTYDTCPHGCVYCYANANKATAGRRFERHEPTSAFLGFTRDQSEAWLKELDADGPQEEDSEPTLFDPPPAAP